MLNLNMTIAARVREERRALGLSQMDLLRRCDFPVAPSALSMLETGKRVWDAHLIQTFAHALGVEPAELLRNKAITEAAATA